MKPSQLTLLKQHWNIFSFSIISGNWDGKCSKGTQIPKFLWPTWGPPGSCRPQMGPMLAPWTLLSGNLPHGIQEMVILYNPHHSCIILASLWARASLAITLTEVLRLIQCQRQNRLIKGNSIPLAWIQNISQPETREKMFGQKWINTLRPTQNGRHFTDDIFKCIFLNFD